MLGSLARLEEVPVGVWGLPRDIVGVLMSGGNGEREEAQGWYAAELGGAERETRQRPVAEPGNGGDRHGVCRAEVRVQTQRINCRARVKFI